MVGPKELKDLVIKRRIIVFPVTGINDQIMLRTMF